MGGFRVTYATLSADDAELNAAYDAAARAVRNDFGAAHALRIGGEDRSAATFATRSPIDTGVEIGHFAVATADDVDDAVRTARAAQPAWAGLPWQERCDVLDRAADVISERAVRDGAALSWENGKTRLEAIGEVEETADLIRYCTHAMRSHDGFEVPMERFTEKEVTADVMRPYGVWAVIGPFNYPHALTGGPAGAALTAGNTVVIKPSEIGSYAAHLVRAAFVDAGVPPGAVNLLTGGPAVGSALVDHPGLDGLTFTGSCETGTAIRRAFSAAYPKPVICEMGGKNPVIVSDSADLDLAVEGTVRSAFGFAGQKCSAASRAFVHESVHDEFVARLVERTAAIPAIGPLDDGGFLSPVIDDAALRRFDEAVAGARSGGAVLVGGDRLTDGARAAGNFVEPTIVAVPDASPIWTTELFVPLLAVRAVSSLDDAIARANALPYGLTAGMFADDDGEVDRFLDRIEAGVVYVNRAAGATTGAWPGVQPFGGWKASGTAGTLAGGPYYLEQYLREQSRTRVVR